MVRRFTKILADLYVNQKVGLTEALKIMEGRSENCIGKAAGYIFQALEEGNFLSNAIKSCPFINFDQVYVTFIALSEKNGDLRQTISYLNKKYERRHEIKTKLIEVSIYPAFVITLAAGSCFYLCGYQDFGKPSDLIQMVVTLISVCAFVFFLLGKVMSENKLYEAFSGIAFLIKSGVNMSVAVGCAVQIVGHDTKLGMEFEAAKERLEYGMNLKNAFLLGGEIDEAFYYADAVGNKTEVFDKLAIWMNEKTEKRRKICLLLVEPLFIFITGVFLLAIVIKFFMPYMNNLELF